MFHNIVKYSYDDITICPSVASEISHRSECNTLLKSGFLPIFASPMSTVVDEKNYPMFESNRIIPILPRTKDFPLVQRLEYALDGKWAAFSLQEFEDNFTVEMGQPYNGLPYKVLIDIANGHMERLFTAVSKAKEIWDYELTVMIGNVANPETYVRCCECGADYVRFSIGSGFRLYYVKSNRIHYPIASLINETYLIKKQYARVHNIEESLLPKIVADGGIRGYKDVVKALCPGADYVMIGSEFAKLVESAAPLRAPYDDAMYEERLNRFRFNIREENGHFTVLFDRVVNIKGGLYKKFYGMASRQGQIDMNGSKNKTSEGVCKEIKVTTNIDKWSDNMTDYLKSAMSYLGIKDITSLNPMNVETYVLSENAKTVSINKLLISYRMVYTVLYGIFSFSYLSCKETHESSVRGRNRVNNMSKKEIEDMIRKFWKINRTYKAVIICVFISIGMLFGGRQLINYINSKTHITVSGTVYGKYVGQEHHRYYTDEIFIMAVHPYDKKYKDYSVTVDYSTFAKFDKGDNIAFVMNIFEVTDKSKYDMWYGLGMMTLLIILVALWIYLCLIPFNILDKYKTTINN